MRDGYETIEALLLDLHLNRLASDKVLEVEEAIACSGKLAAQSRAIRQVLSALDSYPAPEPPSNLAESVLARIDQQSRVLPFRQAASAIPAGTARDLSASPVLSLRELIAIAACITLFVGIFVPGYFKAQNVARRNLCRENLRQIWGGLAAYANENDGYVTYAGFVPGGSWLPTRVPNVKRFSNTAPLYQLVRGQYVRDTRVFVCPSAPQGRPMLADSYAEFRDFAEPGNVSYSFQFMNLPRGRLLSGMDPGMVLIADRNPFFDGRAAHRISPYRGEVANSLSHEDGAGQNIVHVDGRGGWTSQPTVGVDQDNIYQAGRIIRYQGTEAPVSPTDTFLVN